jgi:hypothetical protein
MLHSFPGGAPYCHVALPVKTTQAGDPSGHVSDAIEKAAFQACLGLNGLMVHLDVYEHLTAFGEHRAIFPVIFTTANLYTIEGDISEANLSDGVMPHEKLKWQPVPYLFYQYNMSHSIDHRIRIHVAHKAPETMSEALYMSFMRSIAVVSAGGIEGFLRAMTPERLAFDKLLRQ